MCGLLILKHVRNLSDESVVEQWSENAYKLLCKRAGIEPTIGHLKSYFRLGRNFYKGVFGDAVNLLLAAAAYNFKRAMRTLGLLFHSL